MKLIQRTMLGMAVAALVAGCAKKERTEEELMQQRETYRAQMLELVGATNCAAAAELELTTWKTDPEIAPAGFGIVYSSLRAAGDHAPVIAWCEKLLNPELKMPGEYRGYVHRWRIAENLFADDADSALRNTLAYSSEADESETCNLLRDVAGEALRCGSTAAVEKFMARLEGEKAFSENPLFARFFRATHVRLLMGKREWSGAIEQCKKAVVEFPDSELSPLVREVTANLGRQADKKLLDEFAEYVLAQTAEKPRTSGAVAQTWINNGVSADPKGIPARFDRLMAFKVPVNRIGDAFENVFYSFAQDTETLGKLCAFGHRLVAACDATQTNTSNMVSLKLLDGAFIRGNYTEAIAMLEKGIPGQSEEWISFALPKTKAHAELAAAEKAATADERKACTLRAIGFFREFMTALEKSDREEEVDPVSSLAYPKSAILARNELRISGLYAGIGEGEKAATAKAAAKKLYAEALTKAEKDEELLGLLKTEAAKAE